MIRVSKLCVRGETLVDPKILHSNRVLLGVVQGEFDWPRSIISKDNLEHPLASRILAEIVSAARVSGSPAQVDDFFARGKSARESSAANPTSG